MATPRSTQLAFRFQPKLCVNSRGGHMTTDPGRQLAFIGLIGQYLARVFEEVKGRPMYLLKQAPHEPLVSVTSEHAMMLEE